MRSQRRGERCAHERECASATSLTTIINATMMITAKAVSHNIVIILSFVMIIVAGPSSGRQRQYGTVGAVTMSQVMKREWRQAGMVLGGTTNECRRRYVTSVASRYVIEMSRRMFGHNNDTAGDTSDNKHRHRFRSSPR